MSHAITLNSKARADTVLPRALSWIYKRIEAGKPVRLTLDEESRTIPQNSHIHPLVREIAKATERPTDEDSLQTLRYLLLEMWRHETKRTPVLERSLDGLRWVDVSGGTSDLDKPDCSEFIEWMRAQV